MVAIAIAPGVVGYVTDHVVGFVALATSVGHIIVTARRNALSVEKQMSNIEKFLPVVLSAFEQAGEFAAGKAATIVVPAESTTIELPNGAGKVTVSESGTVLTFVKSA